MGHGIFISYAHADNQPLGEGARGWVKTFVDHLTAQINRQPSGRQAAVWMDYQLRPQAEVQPELDSQVGRCDCLVAMMSPAYLDSVWCGGEIGKFVEKMGGKPGDRVFVVELMPTDRTQWHPATQQLSIIQCWSQEQAGTAAMTLGWPVPNPMNDKVYWGVVNKLAHDIVEQLNRAPALPPGTPDTPQPRPPDAPPCVWIAEPTDDLADEWQQLVSSLAQHGFEVAPAGAYVRGAQAAWEQGLAADLGRAGLLVQLLGAHPGRRAGWSPLSYAQLQAQAAAEAAQARQLGHLVWRPPELDLGRIDDPQYLNLLRGTRSGGFTEFRQEVLDACKRLAKPVPLAPPPGEAPLIYINADDCDQGIGDEVCNMLADLGAEAVLAAKPAPTLQPADFRKLLEDQIVNSDGMLIVYGQAPAQWAQSQYALARKALAQARSGICALLDAPPPDKPKHGIYSRALTVFDCRQGITIDPLQNFVASVRGRRTTGETQA
jgi:TIR domain